MIFISSSLRIPDTLQIQIKECLLRCLHAAETQFQQNFVMPCIFIHKKGSIAGTAHLRSNTIKLNGQLLLEHQTTFIEEIVPHEFAHLLVYTLYGKVRPHGKEWQSIMESLFKLPAKRTHSFTNRQLQLNRFRYTCQCQIHYLTLIRHNRIQRKRSEYHCLQCKQKLRLS